MFKYLKINNNLIFKILFLQFQGIFVVIYNSLFEKLSLESKFFYAAYIAYLFISRVVLT